MNDDNKERLGFAGAICGIVATSTLLGWLVLSNHIDTRPRLDPSAPDQRVGDTPPTKGRPADISPPAKDAKVYDNGWYGSDIDYGYGDFAKKPPWGDVYSKDGQWHTKGCEDSYKP